MKIQIKAFKGRAPRYAARLLPDGMAQVAENPRLLSGNLEAWKANDFQFSLAKKVDPYVDVINTIFPMDIHTDEPKWLHWTDSELGAGAVEVDVAKGPIVGDTSQRVYLTGLDAPRWTDLLSATSYPDPEPDPPPVVGAFPYVTYLLGIPAPGDPLEVSVEGSDPDADPGEDAIPVENWGAEIELPDGWTTSAGALGRGYSPGLPDPGTSDSFEGTIEAYEGDFYFAGSGGNGTGTDATTTAFQDIDLEDNDLAIGQQVTLQYRVAAGPSLGTARMTLSFYTAADALIETVAYPYPAPNETSWQIGIVQAYIPDTTAYIRLTMAFQNGGTAGVDPNDGYIDNIKFRAQTYTYASNGNDLGNWEINAQVEMPAEGGREVFVEVGVADYGDVFRMKANGAVAWIRKDFKLTGGNFTASFDYRNARDAEPYLVIGSTRAGQGEGLNFNNLGSVEGDRLKMRLDKNTFTDADSRGLYNGEELSDLFYQDIGPESWQHVELTGTRNEDGWRVAFTITKTEDNTIFAQGEVDIRSYGDWLQFKTWGNGDALAYADYDNVRVDVQELDDGTGTGGGDQATSAVNYVYTYVNSKGEESAPSPVSATVARVVGRGMQLERTDVPAPEFDAVKWRIYRSTTGDTGTIYRFLVELDIGVTEYLDTKTDAQLGEELITADFDTPPANGRGILACANGITYMFYENTLVPSEKFRPYAYPVKYRLATDYPIVAIGTIDTDVVIATQSHPYIAQGDEPGELTMSKLEKPQGCESKRSLVSMTNWGVVYASPDGLTAVTRQSVRVITESLFSRKEWQALNPASIHAVEHDGKYFGWYIAGAVEAGFIFDPGESGFGWIDLDFYASAAFSNPITDELYIVVDGDLFIWDADATKLAYTWKSKQFKLPHPASFAAADIRITAGTSVTLKLFADGAASPYFTKVISTSGEFVCPPVVCADFVEIQFEGTGTVQEFTLAEAMDEIP